MASHKNKFWSNLVTGIHVAVAILVFGGTIFMIFFPQYSLIHVCVITIVLTTNIPFSGNCPLTVLEEKLRRKIDPDYRNNNSFMTTYLNKIFKTKLKKEDVHSYIGMFFALSYAIAAINLTHKASFNYDLWFPI